MIALTFYSTGNLELAVGLLFVSNMSVAFSDVIVDSLMVIQSRKYPDGGSEELNAFSWTCFSIGGLLGSFMAAILTQNFEPKYCFLYSSFMGFVIAAVALRLNIQIEKEGLTEEDENSSFYRDVRRNISEVRQACQLKEYYRVILYLVISALTVPSFSSFGYYFMLDEVKLSKFSYSMLGVLAFVCLLLGSQMYNKYFRETEYRKMIIIDTLITIVFAPFTFVFVCRWNLAWGISDMFFVFFIDIVDEIISQCFIFLPMSVIFAKITPKHIEATSFALLASVSNFRSTVRGLIGAYINDAFVGVTIEDLSKYWQLVAIGFACSFIPLFFLFLIPTKAQINTL